MRASILFYREFLKAFEQSGLTIEEYKRGGDTFTEKIMGVIEAAIRACFRCSTGREYYRIDAIGWKERKFEILEDASRHHVNPHLWDLCIAVEHENDPKDWTDELIKLAHINCPLKVIIGYVPCDERDDGELWRLDLAASWLSKLNAYQFSFGEYLLIFGNSSAANRSISYDRPDYRGYLLDPDSGKFVRISG